MITPEQLGFEFIADPSQVFTLANAFDTLQGALIIAAENSDHLNQKIPILGTSFLKAANSLFLFADVTHTLVRGLAATTTEVVNLNGAMQTLQSAGVSAGNLRQLQLFSEALFLNGEAANYFTISASAMAARLEDSQNFVGTLFAGSADVQGQVEGLGQAINDLVSGPLKDSVSQNAATQASYDWLSAFPEYAEDIDGVTRSMEGLEAGLMLASATGTSTDTALRGLAQTMISFDRDADEAAQTAAQLNAIVSNGVTTFPEFADKIGRLSGSADAAGISFEEMAGAFALMTRTMGTDTGLTSLNQLFLQVSNLSPQAKDELRSYGLVVNETTLENQGLVETLNQIYEAIGRDREILQKIIPEQQAFAAAWRLVEDGGDDAREAIEDISSVGTEGLEALFGQRQQSAITKWTNLVNKAGRITTEYGERLMVMMKPAIAVLDVALSALDGMPGVLKNIATLMIGLVVVANQASKGIGRLAGDLWRIAKLYLTMRASAVLFDGTLLKVVQGQITYNTFLKHFIGLRGAAAAAEAAGTAATGASTLAQGSNTVSRWTNVKAQYAQVAATGKGIGLLIKETAMLVINGKARLANMLTLGNFVGIAKVATSVVLFLGKAIFLGIAAWKAFGVAIKNSRDRAREFNKSSQELREEIGLLGEDAEEAGNIFQKAFSSIARYVVDFVQEPIQKLQELINGVIWLMTLGFVPDALVTNSEKAAADIQAAIGRNSDVYNQVRLDGEEMWRALRDGGEVATADIEQQMERTQTAIDNLRAAQEALADEQLTDEDRERFEAIYQTQIDGLEGVQTQMRRYSDSSAEMEQEVDELALKLNELADALALVESTKLPLERFRELNRELALQPGQLADAISLYQQLTASGSSEADALDQVSEALDFNEAKREGFMAAMQESIQLRQEAIAEELAFDDALQGRIDRYERAIRAEQEAADELESTNAQLQERVTLLQIEAQTQQQALTRENTLLQARGQMLDAELEQETNAARRRGIERDILENEEAMRANAQARAAIDQQLAETQYAAQVQQIEAQRKLEDIELRREAIKLRMSDLDQRIAIAETERAIKEAERLGNIEEAATLRDELNDREDVRDEISDGLEDLERARAEMERASAAQVAAAGAQFEADNRNREQGLLEEVLGGGGINLGPEPTRQRDRQYQTDAERALEGAIQRRDRDEINRILAEQIGSNEFTPDFNTFDAGPGASTQSVEAAISPDVSVRVAPPTSNIQVNGGIGQAMPIFQAIQGGVIGIQEALAQMAVQTSPQGVALQSYNPLVAVGS